MTDADVNAKLAFLSSAMDAMARERRQLQAEVETLRSQLADAQDDADAWMRQRDHARKQRDAVRARLAHVTHALDVRLLNAKLCELRGLADIIRRGDYPRTADDDGPT